MLRLVAQQFRKQPFKCLALAALGIDDAPARSDQDAAPVIGHEATRLPSCQRASVGKMAFRLRHIQSAFYLGKPVHVFVGRQSARPQMKL